MIRYILLLSQYPWVILLSSGLLSVVSIICSLTLQVLPDFSDPQEVRWDSGCISKFKVGFTDYLELKCKNRQVMK